MMENISSMNDEALEALYHEYQTDPDSVDSDLRAFFRGFDLGYRQFGKRSGRVETSDEFRVITLIDEYRKRGHLFTRTNPVRTRRKYSPTLAIENFGLSEMHLDQMFDAGEELGIGRAKLREIIAHLEETYCQGIGAEFMFIRNLEIDTWLKKRMEGSRNRPQYTPAIKKVIITKLREAVYLEKFIHKKFPGQKRFSLEGAESLIPALDAVIELGAGMGTSEFVIGMAHRGRLNVLANILKKPLNRILSEFSGHEYDDRDLLGDVKYHLGFTTYCRTKGGKDVRITIAPNPSHLEAVNPVVEGISRARTDRKYPGDYSKIAPILIHGDASIAGQGIVYEVLQMSGLPAYHTGGTVHLVINNQIGFTTNYLDARTSVYCTDVAKVIQSPVFHVNGDDVEAVVYTMRMAMEFRERFKRDVFVDILCYRKYGHNESDEPRFTQPVLYRIIESHPDPYAIYKEKLIQEGAVTAEEVLKDENLLLERMEDELDSSKEISKATIQSFLSSTWEGIRRALPEDFVNSPETSVSKESLEHVAGRIASVPTDKPLFRKILRLQEERLKMVTETGKIDWGMAELLAYGTLLAEGYNVRMTGQDVERGTFSHRHAVLRVEDSEEEYVPLEHIAENQGQFSIYNSLLSEYGVLGFEYGYALASPNTLTLWEAQFGDFNNGAQIIFDQFISSAEEKWNVMNGLVVLLPHGYEGQGPEHSSARIERTLALCADYNMQVANCTTPANLFHLLRRQLHRDFRKPLIIFTPKSLLRHPECVSSPEEFTAGGFMEVIDDHQADPEKVHKVVFCSGKIWYDLALARKERQREDIALVRLEQLYPLPVEQMVEIVARYTKADAWLWTQEEPGNMGAWTYISRNFKDVPLRMVARPDSGSPATGSSQFHKIRQAKVIEKTFGDCHCERVKEECRMVCSQREF
ncbi:MAG: 2-oxoglutarate dehydrogenase E1 component [Bacteroidales bacterium]